MGRNRTELGTLKRLLFEADQILSAPESTEKHTARCRELLQCAMALTEDLLKQERLPASTMPAGKSGNRQTLQ